MELGLKEQLMKIIYNDYELPKGYNLSEISENMLSNIGALDPELRDKLIYSTFHYWIIEKNFFTKEQLREILITSLDDNHLFLKIGNKGDDSVLTRAFSVLLIPLLLIRHKHDPFLNEEDKKMVIDKVLAYFEQEKDYRGFIENKGWAHAVAHGADALDEIAKSEFVSYNELSEMLGLIKNKVSIEDYVYVNEEDERLVTAIISIVRKGIVPDFLLVEWINSFGDFTFPKTDLKYVNLLVNIKSFLRSLYFRMIKEEGLKHFLIEIEKILDKFSRYD